MSDIIQPKFRPSAPASPGKILRSEFFALTPADQRRAMREGWTLTDDPAPQSKPISRAAFDKMPPAGQALFTGRGGMVAE